MDDFASGSYPIREFGSIRRVLGPQAIHTFPATRHPQYKGQAQSKAARLESPKRLRDRALFDLAIDSKLRGCDLVKLKIGDLVSGGNIRNRSTVVQQTTGRPVQFEIMSEARKSLTAWLDRRRGTLHDFVFPSRIDYLGHLSTRQYARLVDEWVSTVGLNRREYGTHSLRRTKAALIYKATGNLRAVQILLGEPVCRVNHRQLSTS